MNKNKCLRVVQEDSCGSHANSLTLAVLPPTTTSQAFSQGMQTHPSVSLSQTQGRSRLCCLPWTDLKGPTWGIPAFRVSVALAKAGREAHILSPAYQDQTHLLALATLSPWVG